MASTVWRVRASRSGQSLLALSMTTQSSNSRVALLVELKKKLFEDCSVVLFHML